MILKQFIYRLEWLLKKLVSSGEIEKVSYFNPLKFIGDIKKGLDYDLCITDINMPEMNGLDLAEFLKSNPSTKIKPILALTTEDSDAIKQKAKEIGLTGWITKPFTAQKVETIKSIKNKIKEVKCI